MSEKNKKEFGIWMDSHHAIIAGREDISSGAFVIVALVNNPASIRNSNETTAHNQQSRTTQKFFKAIASMMPNVDELHITGTGQVQEQFINFLADTPQYKNVVCTESTSNKMGNEQLLAFIANHFNI